VNEKNMFSTFNMGVGLVIAVEALEVEAICKTLEKLGERVFILGSVENGGKGICLK
jgi:phosphoribosylformylglycinamidine cyclo-ligase